ncbi:MAG: tetratricopeptide repeat protein [Candidatus Aminicenantes bacterium]|jgi:PAS domain S-box-containing protein
MNPVLKRYLRCCALLLLLPSLLLFSQTNPERIEAQLAKTEGKEKINLLVDLLNAYKRKNPQKALEYGKQALELLKTFPDEKTRAAALNSISNVYKNLGKQKSAKVYALKSLTITEKIDDKPGAAAARDSLGEISIIIGELDQALDYYNKNLHIYKELKDQARLARTLNSIGTIHFSKSDYPQALEFYHRALKVYEALNDQKGIGGLNSNIGSIHWEFKDTEKSLEYYLKSLEIFEKLKDERNIASTLDNIGIVYSYLGNYDKALEYYDRALAISEKLIPRYLTSVILNHMGEVHKELNNNQKALAYFNQALAIKEKLKDITGIAEISINIASIDQRLGRYQEAIQKVNKGLDIARESKVKSMISDAYQVLSETYETMGEHQKALGFYKKFKEINDTIFNENTTRTIAGLRTNFELERKENEIKLLKKDRENQRMRFNFLIIFALLIGLLAFVVYTRYRLKARVTRELEKEIEERKLYEQKLRESEEKFRVLAEKSLVGIWIIQDQVIQYANPRSLKIFGFTLEEMMNKNPLDLVAEEDRPLVTQHLQERIKGTSNTRSLEFKGITKEGDIINIESYGALTLYQGKPAVLESVIDITLRKKAELELFKSRKMESVGILAGGIAHDFNNLLAVIVGNTSMMKLTFGENNAKLNTLLDNVERAASQAADLAQKFITFSEGGWLMRKKVKLANILRDTVKLSPEIKNMPCEISIPSDLDYIYGDERQLRQVFNNLLLNARESTADTNRKITVFAKNITLDNDNPFSLKEGKYVQVSVIDNGKGIPPELLEKIFDPYFTTKTTVSQKGLGLGLALCYSIVNKHGGHISLDSKVQKGTTVDVYLPVFSN